MSRSGTWELPHGANMRDLGGWNIPGGQTAYYRLVRSGLPNRLSRSARRQALKYGGGVAHVLDLRSPAEIYARPDSLSRKRDVDYHGVCLYDVDISAGASLADQMAESYLQMLANREAIRLIFTWLAKWAVAADGVILYHCTGGMDRTGMLSMLLLGMAGVSREDVCRDYLKSFGSWDDVDEALWAPGSTGRPSELITRRDTFLNVYDSLVESYGGFGQYLYACGVTGRQINLAVRWLTD